MSRPNEGNLASIRFVFELKNETRLRKSRRRDAKTKIAQKNHHGFSEFFLECTERLDKISF